MKRTITLLASLLSLSVAWGCQNHRTQSVPTPAGSGAILAQLNGQPITEEEVRKVAGPQLVQAEVGLYEARKEGIDQIIEDRLLEEAAKKKGISKADLLKKEVFDKIKVADADIEKFYKENKERISNKPLEEVKENIRGFLYQEGHQKIYGGFIGDLKKKAKVEFLISVPKVEIEEGDWPAQGPKGAPIRLVEFTDYQCPFCSRARPAINQVLDEYKGKVRYILRDFPLSFHKDSIKAHEAAHCAGDQGKYWEMNKKLWENQKAIAVEDLKKYAGEIHLKKDPFNQCLDSGKYQAKVQESVQYGQKVGVSGTPAFFINGRMISGARPFASFKEIIDDELSK